MHHDYVTLCSLLLRKFCLIHGTPCVYGGADLSVHTITVERVGVDYMLVKNIKGGGSSAVTEWPENRRSGVGCILILGPSGSEHDVEGDGKMEKSSKAMKYCT